MELIVLEKLRECNRVNARNRNSCKKSEENQRTQYKKNSISQLFVLKDEVNFLNEFFKHIRYEILPPAFVIASFALLLKSFI